MKSRSYESPVLPAALLCFLAVGCGNSAGGVEQVEGALHVAEVDAIKTASSQRCDGCFFVVALDLTLPIPDRYVMVSDPGDACISFSAPAGTLLRQATDPALVQLQHGLISYCALDELDRDMEEMGRKALPTTAYEWRGLSVQEWNPSSVNRHHITYIKSATEALLIQDMNPLLWNAMRQFIERTNC